MEYTYALPGSEMSADSRVYPAKFYADLAQVRAQARHELMT